VKNFRNLVDTYVLDREKHKKHLAVVLSLSMLVTFAVPLSLMQPAESMTANKGFMGMPLARAVDADGRTLVDNLNGGQTANNGYSLGQLSEVALLIGEGDNERLEWTKNCKTAKDVVEAAKNEYFLGIASDFCVFLEGDFNIKDADAEGRVAVGGSFEYARLDNNKWNYQLGAGDYGNNKALIETSNYLGVKNFAHLIIGGIDDDPSSIKKVAPFGTKDEGSNLAAENNDRYRRFVVPTANFSWDDSNHYADDGTEVKYGQNGHSHYNVNFSEMAQFYSADLIDFAETFKWIRLQSDKLSKKNATGIVTDNGSILTLTGPGQNADVETVYFNLDSWNSDTREVHFVDVPADANLVVNCGGKTVSIANDVKTYIGTEIISNTGDKKTNNNKRSEQILYNFYEAGKGTEDNIDEKDVYIDANFNGTILAPYANVKSEDGCGGHLSGALIAMSFKGGLEFGYRPYRGTTDILGSTSGYTIPVDKFKMDGTTRLPGADFKLTITDQDDNVVTSWTSGNDTEYVNIPTMIDFTGGETYTEGDQFTQSYTVKEESAPKGYVKTDKKYTITVSETVNEIMTVENKTIPTNVTVNLTFRASDDSTAPSDISFTIQDIYKDDAQIRREINFNDAEYWLEIENQKVTKIVKPGETITSEYPEDGTTYYLESIQYTETKIHSSTETETSMITSVISNEESTSVTEIVTYVPKTEVQTEMVVVTDESNNPVYGNDGSTLTEPKVISSSAVTGTSVEYGESIVSYYEEAKNTTYTKTTEIPEIETLPEVPQPPTKGTVTIESKPFYFDPDSLMLMPMPSENLSFTNDYGFVFKKVDEGGNLVTGATVILEKKKPDGSYTEEKQITASSITLDPAAFNENTLYRFRESSVPTGYEEAMPIYLVKIGKTIFYIESETEPAMPSPESHDGWTEFAINAEDDKRVVSMTDQKIHGVKLKLYKSDADNADKVLKNTVFSLYPDGSETPIKTGITIANGKNGFDFYEAFKNETGNEYIKNGYLVPGTYYLEETDPPDEAGYEGNAKNKYYFTVKSDYTIGVGKPDAIPINIQGDSTHPTKIYYPCDASGAPLNDTGASIADVIAISFKVRDEVKTHSNIGELDSKVHSGSTLHTKEFSSPQTLKKLEFQTTDWTNKDVFVEYVEIQTKDGKKYVYKASESGGNSGNTGGDSGNTGGDSGNTGGNTGGNTSGTQTVPEDFPNTTDGNTAITINDTNSGKQWYLSDANGNTMNQDTWNGSTGIANVTSVRLITNNPPKIYFNVEGYDQGKTYDTTDTTITFNSQQNISKFEIQPKNWNDGIQVLAIAITTADGKQYVYNPSGASGDSGNTGGDSGNTGGDSGNTGSNPNIPADFPELSDGDTAITTSNTNSGKQWYPIDANGNTMNQDNWNGSVGIANVTSIRLITNNPLKIYTNAGENVNEKTYDTTDTTITFNSPQNISKFEIQPKNWNDGIEVYAIAFTTSDGKQYIYRAPSEASTLSLALFSETPKATAEEAEEESDALEITQKTEDGRIVLDIPNKYSSDFNITVEKLWEVKGNNSLIPNELTLTLERKKDGGDWETYSCTPVIDKSNNVRWTYKYNNLPVDDGNGKKYYYKIQEKDVPNGYEVSYSENVTNGVCKDDDSHVMTVTNTLKTISCEVRKTWNKNGADVTLPDSIEVKLQYSKDNGTTWMDIPDSTQTLTGSGWTYTYTGLPSNCIYRAVEVSVPAGWNADNNGRSNTSNTDGDTLTLTNTYQTAGLKVAKKWLGDNDSNRPENVTVLLYRKAVPKGAGGGATVTPTEPTDADGQYDQTADYSRLLQYSLYFYDANMCGTEVTENSAVSWRDDCHTGDSVPGGFHDAGDHAMFGLPQGFTASTLGWSYYEFSDSFEELGLKSHYKLIMDEFCDFFVDSTTISNGTVTNFVYQKGNGGTDHGYWGKPEDQEKQSGIRQIYSTTNSASDIAAEYAAALALHILNFPEDHPNLENDEYLKCAKALYDFSTKYNAVATDGPSGFYPINNYYNSAVTDDQAWAAAWLYVVTGEDKYKNECKSKLDSLGVDGNGHYWYNVTLGAEAVYAAHVIKENTDNNKWNEVTSFLNTCKNRSNNSYLALNDWGSTRHNTLTQLVALATDKNMGTTTYQDWCKWQMAYILGNNNIQSNGNSSTCFVTGFADNSSKYVHHRAASGYTNDQSKDNLKYDSDGHILVGALVGGPNTGGNYTDKLDGDSIVWQTNEVAIDYNAGLVGAAAGLYSVYGTGTLADSLDDFPEENSIETLYPAASTLTVNAPENQKANAIKGISQMWSGVKAKAYTEVYTITNPDTDVVIPLSLSNISKIVVEVDFNGVGGYNSQLIYNTHNGYFAITGSYHEFTLQGVSDIENVKVTTPSGWNGFEAKITAIRFYTESSDPVFTIFAAISNNRTEAFLTDTVTLTPTNNAGNVTYTVKYADNTEETLTGNTFIPKKSGTVTITGNDGTTNSSPITITVLQPKLNAPTEITAGQTGEITVENLENYTVKFGNTVLTETNGVYQFTAPDVTADTKYMISVLVNNTENEVVSQEITVKPFVFTITQNSVDVIEQGGTATLTANAPATWTIPENYSSNITLRPSTDSRSCTVEGKDYTADTITITATDDENNTDTAEIRMLMSNDLTLSFENDKDKIRVGETTILKPVPGNNVTFSFNPADCVEFDESQKTVKALKAGTVTINAQRGNASKQIQLTIYEPLTLSGRDKMNIGETQTLQVVGNIGNLTWTSDNEAAVTVENGNITAIDNGTATITVKDIDGAEKSITISVELTALLVDTTGLKQVGTITITKAQSDSGDTWTNNVAVDVYNNPLDLANLPLVDEYGNKYEYYIVEKLDSSGDNTLKTPTAVYVPVSYDGNGLILNENDTNNTITVGNKLKSSTETTGQMPSAGGRGTDWYYIAGAAMMLAGLAGYFVLKRRQRSRAEA